MCHQKLHHILDLQPKKMITWSSLSGCFRLTVRSPLQGQCGLLGAHRWSWWRSGPPGRGDDGTKVQWPDVCSQGSITEAAHDSAWPLIWVCWASKDLGIHVFYVGLYFLVRLPTDCCETFFPLQHSKTPRTPNLSKICPSDCFSGFQSGCPKFVKNLSKFEKR